MLRALLVWGLWIAAGVEASSRSAAGRDGSGEIDPVRRLAVALASNEVELEWEPRFGRLLAVLQALEIPLSSQVLVFSKTSLQRDHISPGNPRAIYFNDEAYVGWIPGAPWIELAGIGADGASFFVISQVEDQRPRLKERQDCLQCHESGLTQGVPGLLVRSVHPARDGQAILRFGSFATDHRSPYAERWGGWYLDGKFEGAHLGNRFADEATGALAFRRGESVMPEHLGTLVDLKRYPQPSSDVVALLVLEHQVQAQNLFARAARDTSAALTMRATMNRLDQLPLDAARKETTRRIDHQARRLLDYLIFVDEAALTTHVDGSSSFAREFASRGVRDKAGRSLKDLRLRRRLMRWPLSYLVHSHAFAALPRELRERFWTQLDALLTESEEDLPAAYDHLTPNARHALRAHLIETHADAAWFGPWNAEEESKR